MTAVAELSPHERQEHGPNANAFAPARPFTIFRRLSTEALGTFLLVFVDCGGAIGASLSSDVTAVGRSLATGLIVMAMASAMADVSGAHFNPAVTVAFAMRKAFPWKMVPFYFLAQLTGALLASASLHAIFGNVAHLGATLPEHGVKMAFATELVITTALVSISLATATRHRVLGPQAAIAAGGTVAACALFARPFSGASMNPARSLAPALVSGHLEFVWIYLVAPLLASVIGCGVMSIVHTRHHKEELEAASGEPK